MPSPRRAVAHFQTADQKSRWIRRRPSQMSSPLDALKAFGNVVPARFETGTSTRPCGSTLVERLDADLEARDRQPEAVQADAIFPEVHETAERAGGDVEDLRSSRGVEIGIGAEHTRLEGDLGAGLLLSFTRNGSR